MLKLDSALEIRGVDGIAIAEQVGGAGLVRERVDDLLGRPGGGGLVGDADVDEFSAVVAEYHEAEEEAKGQGRYDEEVDGCDVVTVSSQEGPPGRRRVGGGAARVLGDGEGSDFVAEEAEFGLNPAPVPGDYIRPNFRLVHCLRAKTKWWAGRGFARPPSRGQAGAAEQPRP
jgi:hypothetical protein